MGDWNSLHLLDEEKYESKTLKILGSPDLMLVYYKDYLNYCLKGECEWTLESIVESMQMNSDAFRLLRTIDEDVFEERAWKLPPGLDDYHFRRFVSFLIFQTSAQFFPYFKMGKNSLWNALNLSEGSLAAEIIDHVFMAWGPFNIDGIGIRKIIGKSDLSLFVSDSENIKANSVEGQDLIDQFIYFLEFASNKGLGLLSGQNLDEDLLTNNHLKLDQGIKFPLNHLVYQTSVQDKK